MRNRTIVLAALLLLAAGACRSARAGGPDAPAPPAEGAAGRESASSPSDRTPPGPPDGPAGEDVPTDAERRLLLALARASIETRLGGDDAPRLDPSCVTPYLARPLACFVTLNTADGDLRGCIGMFEAERPLWENVADRARAAAFSDSRFRPVRDDELPSLVLDISILTPPRSFAFDSPEDLLARLRPLVDGVLLHSPWGSSTFLPQVWEQLPEREEFLGQLCRKHGAPAECWRDPALRVETYQAVVFSEHEQPAREGDWFTIDESGRFRCPAAAPE